MRFLDILTLVLWFFPTAFAAFILQRKQLDLMVARKPTSNLNARQSTG